MKLAHANDRGLLDTSDRVIRQTSGDFRAYLSVSSWSGPTRARLIWPQAEVGQRRHRFNRGRRLGGATGQRSTGRG
jgi:hypothetical protein